LELPSPTKLHPLVEAFKRDKDPFELREEIATTRAAISKILEEVDEEGTDLLRAGPVLNMLLNTTGKLVQKLHDIEVGRKYVVRVDHVQRSLRQILAIVVENVPDAEARSAIAEGISNLAITEQAGTAPVEVLTAKEVEMTSLLRQ